MSFKPMITRIPGLSDRRRLPRLGIIRLGIKVKNQKGVEYPKETEYFVCPDEVKREYGDKPTELDVMLPINDIDAVFPASYKFYGSSRGLKCQGNGEIAHCVDKKTGGMVERTCPCENFESTNSKPAQCKPSATLMIMIPKVSIGGIFQVRTSSYNSIVDINSGIDYVSALLGRFALVPLKLRREKIETHHNGKKQFHYTLKIIFDADINTLNALRSDTQRVLEHPRYQLSASVDENPEFDPPDQIIDEENIINVEPEKTLNAIKEETSNTPQPGSSASAPAHKRTPNEPPMNALQKGKLIFEGGKRGLTDKEVEKMLDWYKQGPKITKKEANELLENFDSAFSHYTQERQV